MPIKRVATFALCTLAATLAFAADRAPKKKILYFTKSSGFEHSVITWKNGQPSYSAKVLQQLGDQHGWEIVESKDGSKFSKDYLAQFDAVFFYTSGDLCSAGTDKQPPMSADGKQALFDYVRSGKAFIATHAACDSFHTANESKKGPDRYVNHGEQADPYVRFLGGEFIKHGAQQMATNTVTNPKFPGFEKIGSSYALFEEWYSIKDFTPDIHVLSVIDSTTMKGAEYKRPPYPVTWARKEGSGRVFYTAMGHREDIWTNSVFQQILVGGVKWALGEAPAETPANIKEVAPGAYTNPPYEPTPAATTKPGATKAKAKVAAK